MMAMRHLILSAWAIVFATACSSNDSGDLKKWMDEQGANARGNIPPVAPLRQFDAFTYTAESLADPFRPRRIDTGAHAPDLKRRREPLEAFSIETLSMVGALYQRDAMIGLVKAADGKVYQVRAGNYMGQNHGLITRISEKEIQMRELSQDGAGDWAERKTALLLKERDQPK